MFKLENTEIILRFFNTHFRFRQNKTTTISLTFSLVHLSHAPAIYDCGGKLDLLKTWHPSTLLLSTISKFDCCCIIRQRSIEPRCKGPLHKRFFFVFCWLRFTVFFRRINDLWNNLVGGTMTRQLCWYRLTACQLVFVTKEKILKIWNRVFKRKLSIFWESLTKHGG